MENHSPVSGTYMRYYFLTSRIFTRSGFIVYWNIYIYINRADKGKWSEKKIYRIDENARKTVIQYTTESSHGNIPILILERDDWMESYRKDFGSWLPLKYQKNDLQTKRLYTMVVDKLTILHILVYTYV